MLNLPQYLFINGPSDSGKSTLASLICQTSVKSWRESFAEPIRDMIRSVFFPEEGPIDYTYDLRDGPTKKLPLASIANLLQAADKIDPAALPVSVRAAMIGFSETYMKPMFGVDVFGRLLFKRCSEQSLYYDHFIIDDSGFAPEAEYIISRVTPGRCHLVRLHRQGCDFSGDSRGYVSLPGVLTTDLHNDGAAAEMLDTLQLELGNL